ncbi:hypothetical protein [uncultured Chryseobacterium sp.]
MYNSGGQLVMRSTVHAKSEKLDISQLPAGVHIINPGSGKSLKFIKD